MCMAGCKNIDEAKIGKLFYEKACNQQKIMFGHVLDNKSPGDEIY